MRPYLSPDLCQRQRTPRHLRWRITPHPRYLKPDELWFQTLKSFYACLFPSLLNGLAFFTFLLSIFQVIYNLLDSQLFCIYNLIMNYEWDKNKNTTNRAKHGIDFSQARGFEWDSAIVLTDNRKDYGETRYCAFGYIGKRLYCLIFTSRDTDVRVISLRKANKREVKRYAEA